MNQTITNFFQPKDSRSQIGEITGWEIIGRGTFGTVFKAQTANRVFAVKKVFQDPRYKNREKNILKIVNHPNCMRMHHSYITCEGEKKASFLYIYYDYFPTDLSTYLEKNKKVNLKLVKLFAFQMFRALDYLKKIGVCHRDIKTSNILVDTDKGLLQICDFGSAKQIKSGEESVSYIATRNYRAPELLYNCKEYNYPVDVWAAGCVLSEFFRDGPLFTGKSNDEMIVTMCNILGPPTEKDMKEYKSNENPKRKTKSRKALKSYFKKNTPAQFIDLLSKIFVYSPSKRITASECLNHEYFADINDILSEYNLSFETECENTN